MTRKLLVPALVTAALSSALGCGRDNRSSVMLTQLCFPPTPDDNGFCPLTSGKCDKVLADGHLFVDLVTSGGTLVYPVQVDNQRVNNADVTTGRTNTNNAAIERFDMKYEAAGLTLPPGSSSQSVLVPTGGSTVAFVFLIPDTGSADLAAALPAGPTEVVIKVKGHGRYGADTEFDTAEFSVPVAISKGVFGPYVCLNAEGTVDTTKTLRVCPQQGQTAVAVCK